MLLAHLNDISHFLTGKCEASSYIMTEYQYLITFLDSLASVMNRIMNQCVQVRYKTGSMREYMM